MIKFESVAAKNLSSHAGYITLPEHRPRPPLSNGRLGMMLLLGTETILFSCFIGAYLVLRMGSAMWPPAGTPTLHAGLSLLNTAVLVLSSALAFTFRREISRQDIATGLKFLSATFLLGLLFLVLQGVEFHRLYVQGLTLHSGTYGALFYCLITCHGFHVLGGLAFLSYLLWRAKRLGFSRLRERAGYAELYWHFVTVVWLVLFGILYIL